MLVDSSSSHNFINANIVRKIGLREAAIEPFDVKVANREKLKCEEVVHEVKMNVQGVRIATDLHVLSLMGVDVVLSNAWLKSICKVVIDFDAMTMEFKLGGRKKTWVALPLKEIKQCEAQMIERLCKGGAQYFALVNDGDRQEGKKEKKNTNELQDELQRLPEKVCKVVANHRQVLEVPTSLPSPRHCDHRITMKNEVKPVNMPPYRRPPPMLSTYEKGTARNEEVERELMARDEVVAKVKKELEKAQGRMKKYYDQGRRDVLERIGEVVYKLELSSTSRLHLVFHVTVLKKRVGNPSFISSDLPMYDTEGNLLIRPITALRFRNWKKGRGMTKVWQVLVQWQGVPTKEATWEDYDEMVERFPDFSLEDKGILEEQGNVETIRKSKRFVERRSKP
ncbi:hypothetical protein LWI29_000190 [Acer saccharum]|uniref:Tf2-1-like SH3-like domain-containing protein n=1 Tax=Acer saccharum TaxID=4024 RepID=A0AA39RZP5_ACESA|nr:hypothetical protein LWI29_000190 [Acer saccharum]